MKRQLTVYSALEKKLLLRLASSFYVKAKVLRYTKKSITYSLYGKNAGDVIALYRQKVGLNWKFIN